MNQDELISRLDFLAEDSGVQVWVHARRVTDAADEVALDADVPVPMASLYKVPLAGCWAEQVDAGTLDATAAVTLLRDNRTAGPTGVSALLDDVVLSQRDCIRMMLALSDNASATAVLDLVGHAAVQNWIVRSGCTSTTARRGTADAMRAVIAESGGRTLDEALQALADPSTDRTTSEYDPALTSSSTARDLTSMLAQLWTTGYAEPVRAGMRHQAWRHRVGTGFPHDDVTIAGKTGTLGRLRHEIAVIEYPEETPIAVAIMTRSLRPETHQPRVDAAIGTIARLAVNRLRRAPQTQ
ncbi:beta-lactamase class A [Kineosphaera limosa]|uniref:Beta-lactamase class A catalytic domain-containing protein n=1 Tax=Kineosphaera limosa NBRC 100340 TaxID=1184609 RepID=K6WKM1_9MICO|nr:serine hydrolase [Kineosphaera limosa]NYE02886.1 beta-lactamase class A [Kineosphaera limosa]GAB94316.1 hypothetical protein KILIM_004_01080 [Kineosphaera limosa NBRC 100340]